ncbi:chemotaxis-specific protein-glutamate methyltransferase CheB [Natronorubrum daqingense]|uniref:Protein-glutamate methylesterase/protein-glutamine glutaminase n=1 Tax=Natronorubrum daqingense TaxID=588898 RepID=A0A1N6Z560_9EURY|nr:chemotaxis-specific protein-glutamate methyltransferase CheB [Natronorubrum daqingense]APX95457.1 chemotaxis response regulator protein-glutamate methylesterase [Natronorubrum daqingense]SIR21955.1 two-component system, chemotaxis family, response regulator CheB [Natronorubrum daqingense]
MTRVLVVDDSKFMRTVIANALTDADYDVETATNGSEAIETAAEFDPAVVTMDVEMPEMDGIDAVQRIMATNPTLILMLSVHTDEGTESTLDALERGAVDFLHKPDGSDSRTVTHLSEDVVDKVDDLADANVSSIALARASASAYATRSNHANVDATSDRVLAGGRTNAAGASETRVGTATNRPAGPRFRGATSAGSRPGDGDDAAGSPTPLELEGTHADDPTIVIGASTGGPKIVEGLFARLPVDLEAKVLVVQHMPAGFTERFAERLDALSEYDVREATHRASVRSGEAVVAPGASHLEVLNNVGGRLRLGLDDGERLHGVRPAIDVTMESAAEHVVDPLCGVVLTGMGHDGATGIEAIKTAGGHTIAQDEATSPVFGIPCQAIQTGCVDDIAPATELVETIVDAFDTDGETDE